MTKHRLLVLAGAVLSLLAAFCNRDVGGDLVHAATPQADGATCVVDIECASDLCSEGTCARPDAGVAEIDGDCSGGAACVGDATCEDGICVENSNTCIPDGDEPAGNLCGTDTDCCSGHCNIACRNATCREVGAPCTTWRDCCDTVCDANTSRCSDTCSASGSACAGQDCCGGGGCPPSGGCP